MISFTRHDFNMSRIVTPRMREEFALASHDVHLYGLKANPAGEDIRIQSMGELPDSLLAAIRFLEAGGLSIQADDWVEVDSEDDAFDGIRIGIRHHLREDVSVCKRVIQTLLLGMAGKLTLDINLQINRIPPSIPAVTETPNV
jgi:hypothetical protein